MEIVNSRLTDLTDSELPLVTIILPTYNRSHTIQRAVNSVLKQSFKKIELVIIDDGSTDDTLKVLETFDDPRIILVRHEMNKGVTAAKNSGLNNIRGQWFTNLDSDDEMAPDAIEKMINIPLSLDHTVSAVTCNCLDTTTNDFSGKGMLKSKYLSVEELMTNCKGEYWGITKTSLLQNDRFNEKLSGFENILWYKINERANRYYIHEALRIYHTDGEDRLLKSKYDLSKQIKLYTNLIEETFFLEQVKKYRPQEFENVCKNGLMVLRASNNYMLSSKYFELLGPSNRKFIIKLLYKYKLASLIFLNYSLLKGKVKPYTKQFLGTK
jgi:glycosyltransferase involved in cell wall biosynthesis